VESSKVLTRIHGFRKNLLNVLPERPIVPCLDPLLYASFLHVRRRRNQVFIENLTDLLVRPALAATLSNQVISRRCDRRFDAGAIYPLSLLRKPRTERSFAIRGRFC